MPNLFNFNLIRPHIQNHKIDDYDEKNQIIQKWKSNLSTIKGVNEKALQAAFLQGIFGKVLGYKGVTEADGTWNINIEPSTEIDSTAPDGSLGYYSSDGKETTQAVIELKSPKNSLDKKQKRGGKEYGTPVDQAFSYASKYDQCKWVIVSNMIEIRIYKVGRSQAYYEAFHISELDSPDQFLKFHFLLCKDNLIRKDGNSLIYQLSEKTKEHIEDISVQFYNLYKRIRISLFEELKNENPDFDQEILLEKAQKFIDRIIFICFCEDLGLLPTDLLHGAIQRGKNSFSTSNFVIWDEVRGIFQAIDKGSQKHNIPEYDGGLFQYDEVLDELKIKNDFFDAIYEISAHDFNSDLDVNILGHIFEQSIADIEELKANIQNKEYNAQYSSRKREGIFYTPTYITKYIVENTVGKYLEQIKKDLGEDDLPDLETASTPQVEGRYKNRLLNFFKEYEKKLREVKILDPACGSGAFLNQAFDFLLEEFQWIHDQISIIQDGKKTIFQQESYQRSILKDNLYGVDLNEESVEITKLSLWLKTANRRKPLTNLDENIKCGNSLIDDPKVSGDKAFCWEEEFPNIIKNGGFDIVIGNPPYVRIHHLPVEQKNYFSKNFSSSTGQYDLYVLFYENSIKLLKNSGLLGFITSNKFFVSDYGFGLRKFLYQNTLYKNIVDVSNDDVFSDASVYPFIVVLQKCKDEATRLKNKIHFFPKYNQNCFFIPQKTIDKNSFSINFNLNRENLWLFRKILLCSTPISNIFSISRGFRPPPKELIPTPEEIQKHPDRFEKFLKGKDLNSAYLIKWSENYLRYNEKLIKETKPIEIFKKPKVLFKDIGLKINASFDETGFLCLKTIYFIYNDRNNKSVSLKYLLSILNSKLMHYFFVCNFEIMHVRGGYLRFRKQFVEKLPIKKIPPEKQLPFIKKVEEITELKRNFWESKKNLNFNSIISKYSSHTSISLNEIIFRENNFHNLIYSGQAKKLKKISVSINDDILTIFSQVSPSQKIEILKVEEPDFYRRKYLKLYLENLTPENFSKINKFNGNILEKVFHIQLLDYEKPEVVKKIVREWDRLQTEQKNIGTKIQETESKLDQMVYDLYGLNQDEIRIVEDSKRESKE